MSADDLDRDAWLTQALRHAPDVGNAPPAALRDAILREAAAKAKAAVPMAAAKPAASPVTGFSTFWAWLARPPVAAGFASVMAATLVGLMWWDQPMDDAMPRAPSREAPAATAPAVISPPTLSSSLPPVAAQPAPAAVEPVPKSSRADAAPAAAAPEPRRPAETRKAPSVIAQAPTPAPAPAPALPPKAAREMATANDAAVPEAVRPAERAEITAAPATPPPPPAPAVVELAKPAPPPMAAARAPAPAPTPDAAGAGAATGGLARDSAAKVPESSASPSVRSQFVPSHAPSPALSGAARQRLDAVASDREAPRSLRALADAVAVQPQRWSWQRNGGAARPMTAALLSWLSQLAAMTSAPDAGRPSPNAFPGSGSATTELRLLRDGRPTMLIRLDASTVVWTRADEAAGGSVVEVTGAALQALKSSLDDATR